MQSAGVSGLCYSPWLSLWSDEYQSITRSFGQFLLDAASENLTAVSFVDPTYSPITGATDDHPFADIRNGDAFLSQVYQAVTNGPSWKNTVLIITFDEWGGFFDHVSPPRIIAPNATDPDLKNGNALLGFRVPTIVISPFTRGKPDSPRVNSLLFDHTSIRKLIQWRWNLSPMTPRDASPEIGNLAAMMDFQNPRTYGPLLPIALPYPKSPCDVSVGD